MERQYKLFWMFSGIFSVPMYKIPYSCHSVTVTHETSVRVNCIACFG